MTDIPTSTADRCRQLHNELLRRGQACAVDITGDPEDADWVDTPEKAWAAIDESLRLGKEAHNELNALRMKVYCGKRMVVDIHMCQCTLQKGHEGAHRLERI